MKAAIYVRVSTEEQATEHKVSIDVQRARCEALCDARGWDVADVYVDAGVSGAKEDRPALGRLLRDSAAGRFERVVYLKSDRLARNTRLLLQIWEELEQAGVKVLSVEEGFDTSSPAGQMAITMMAATAQFEREQIRERVRMGKHGMARRGQYPCGISPYGYAYDAATKQLVIEPAEADVVRRIYRLYVEGGVSMRGIARTLNEEHVPTRGLSIRSPDGKRKGWLAPEISRILKSTTYKGQWQYGRRHTDRFGKRHANAADEVISVEVPAIVSEGTWELARKRAARNMHHGKGHELGLFYLLRGLLFCDECGRPFKAIGKAAGAKKRDKRGNVYTIRSEYRAYGCRGQDQHPHIYACRTPKTVRAELLEEPVWAAIERALRDPELLKAAAEARIGELHAAESSGAELIAKRRRQLANAERERDGVISLAARGKISEDDLATRLARLDEDMAMWQEEMSRLVDAADWRGRTEEVTTLLQEFCHDIGPTLDVMTREERRELLHTLVDKVWVDGQGNIRIEGAVPSVEDAGGTALQVLTATTRAATAPAARSRPSTR